MVEKMIYIQDFLENYSRKKMCQQYGKKTNNN